MGENEMPCRLSVAGEVRAFPYHSKEPPDRHEALKVCCALGCRELLAGIHLFNPSPALARVSHPDSSRDTAKTRPHEARPVFPAALEGNSPFQ